MGHFYPLQFPVVSLVTLPHESVQTVMVHVPRPGMPCVTELQEFPVGMQIGRTGRVIPNGGVLVGSGVGDLVGKGVQVIVGVAVWVGVAVRVSVGVAVSVLASVSEGVAVSVSVGEAAAGWTGVALLFFFGPQPELARINPARRTTVIRFNLFMAPHPFRAHPLVERKKKTVRLPTLGFASV
jgi:hypothetical protein